MKEETEFSLDAESWPPAHTEDRDSSSDFSAHIVLIWIFCVQVNTAFKKFKISLSLDSSIQLKFLFAQIQLQNQFFRVGGKGVID